MLSRCASQKMFLPIIAAMLLTCGCMKVGPDYVVPDVTAYHLPEWAFAQGNYVDAVDETVWWEQFNDPEFSRLIECALEQNLSLAIAAERIAELQAYRGITQSNLYPDIALGGYGIRVRSEDNVAGLLGAPPGSQSSLFAGAALAGWELDFWGRVRRLVESADYQILAAHEALGVAVLSVTSELARHYITYRALQESIALQRGKVSTLRNIRIVRQSRSSAGIGTTQDVLQVDEALKKAETQLESFLQQTAITQNNIAVLIGIPPQQAVIAAGKQLSPIVIRRMQLPAKVLSRRPDVQQAEFLYAAANANVGAAMGERYPQIALGGVLSFQGDSLNHLFRADRLAYLFGAGIKIPVYTGGSIDANIDAQQSRKEQAKLELQQAVLNAVNDVESCAVALKHTTLQQQQSDEQLASALLVQKLKIQLNTAGLKGHEPVLDATLDVLDAQLDNVWAKHEHLESIICLYKALGGSWKPINDGVEDNKSEAD